MAKQSPALQIAQRHAAQRRKSAPAAHMGSTVASPAPSNAVSQAVVAKVAQPAEATDSDGMTLPEYLAAVREGLPSLAERDYESVTALYSPEIALTLPHVHIAGEWGDGRVLATWARPKGAAAKWPKPTPKPAASIGTDDPEYWQTVIAGEAEALAFARE